MKNEPVLSFIIPTFNSRSVINRCLDSILSNKTSFQYEIIVSDDDSQDDTVDIISNHLSSDKVTILKNSHGGAQKARLSGLRAAKGQIVFFLDSDDQISPDFINCVCNKYIETHFDLLLINALCVSKKTSHILISPKTFKYVSNFSAFQEAVVFGRLGYNCCHVFSKNILEQVDFDNLEELSYTEDLNLYLTLLKDNTLDVEILDAPLYFYSFENHSLSHVITEEKFRSAIYVIKKRFSLTNEYFNEFLNEFVRSNFPLLVDWMKAIKTTRKISFNKRRELKVLLKTDYVFLNMNSIYRKYRKKTKEGIKYFLFWVL